jgi:hypothetical protein
MIISHLILLISHLVSRLHESTISHPSDYARITCSIAIPMMNIPAQLIASRDGALPGTGGCDVLVGATLWVLELEGGRVLLLLVPLSVWDDEADEDDDGGCVGFDVEDVSVGGAVGSDVDEDDEVDDVDDVDEVVDEDDVGLAGSGSGTWSGQYMKAPGLSKGLSVEGMTRPGLSITHRYV